MFSDFSHFARITAYDDWGMDLSAEHAFTDRFNLQAKLFYHDHSDDYASYSDQTYAEQIALSTYNDYILGGMLLGEYQMVDWNTLRAALHYKKDSHEQRDIEDLPFAESQAYTGSASLENETRLVDDKLSLVAGVSYDWFDITKAEDDPETDGNIIENDTPDMTDAVNPMIGATYQVVDSVQLFASVAKKTRFPTLSQIYSGDEANLELDPETAINYTAGVAYAYNDLFKLQVAPFFHDISDYITRDVPPTENPYSQYKNYDEVEMLGFEVSAEVRPFADLSVKIGYMNNDATNRSDGRVTDDVAKVPEHTLNVGVQYTLPVIRTRLNVTMLYVGESYYQLPTPEDPEQETIENDDYTLFNAKITPALPVRSSGNLCCRGQPFRRRLRTREWFPGTGNARVARAELQDVIPCPPSFQAIPLMFRRQTGLVKAGQSVLSFKSLWPAPLINRKRKCHASPRTARIIVGIKAGIHTRTTIV